MQGAAPLARGGNPYYMGTEMVETIRASRRQYAVLSSTTSRWGAPTDGDAPRDLAYDLSTAQPGRMVSRGAVHSVVRKYGCPNINFVES